MKNIHTSIFQWHIHVEANFISKTKAGALNGSNPELQTLLDSSESSLKINQSFHVLMNLFFLNLTDTEKSFERTSKFLPYC